MPSKKSVCFDVLGTCFTFDAAISTVSHRIGGHLRSAGVDAKTLVFSWFFAAQRDFSYASVCDAYVPIAQVLRHTFRRACLVVDVPASAVKDEDVEAVMKAVMTLPPRPGLKECFDGLRNAGWDVCAVTNGGKQTSLNYYADAGIQLDEEHLLSCDEIRVAKPDVRVYETANRHLTARGLGEQGNGERWFVAAHGWDLLAARKAGFRTAWLAAEEHDPVTAVFGEFDVYAEDFADLEKKLKAI